MNKKISAFFYSLLASLLAVGAILLSPSQAESAAPSAGEHLELFRDVFSSYLSQRYSPRDQELLMYFPTAELLKEPTGAGSGAKFFAQLMEKHHSLSPFSLYQEGLQHPARPMDLHQVEAAIQKLAGKRTNEADPDDLLTLVIVPGVFGEFIKSHAFEEALQEPSLFGQKWLKQAKKAGATDLQFSLDTLTRNPAPLSDLVRVGTLYGANGAALAHIVILHTEEMSLESMGDNREVARIFRKRLRAYFQIMGTPSNLFLLGYSRGTPLALEMLAQARLDQNDRWLSKVRALIGLGGVIYGSDIADVAMNHDGKNSAMSRELQALMTLSDSLIEIPESAGVMQWIKVTGQNDLQWLAFFRALATIQGEQWLAGMDFSLDKIRELQTAFQIQKGIDAKAIIAHAIKIGFECFRLQTPNSQYNTNVRRLKRIVTEAITAVRQLTTAERLAWWSHSIVPTRGIRYYSIAGTMMNPESDNPAEIEISTNNVSYNPLLPDFHSLQNSYLDFYHLTGVQTNDSQVAIEKARFWPEVHRLLNPAQPPLDARFLGVLGVHHWGMALPIVTEMKSGALDPYPRKDLLKALLGTVALEN
jgi:pimeloyl-ACP methyl ester carboxylesterase